MSPEPQTPSRLHHGGIESRSQLSLSTRPGSAALGNANSSTFNELLSAQQATPRTNQTDRVLRSAQQPTPKSNQVDRSLPRPQTPDSEDGLAARVINLLESYNIHLSSKQLRKLRVEIDDYMDDMETELSLCKEQLETLQEADRDRYLVD
jgi:hypothetical protein